MKKINVIITIDDNGGLMFNGRRQSRDRVLIDDMCKKTDGKLYVNEYSASLFCAHPDKIIVTSNPLTDCPNGGYAFLEGTDISSHLDEIEELTVYYWNRLYPSDIKLGIDIQASEFKLTCKYDFKGSSHEKITKGIYKK